jgi:chromosomal replication initiation ATPase DnaA
MGSQAFAQRIRKIVSPQSNEPHVLRTRSRPDLTLEEVLNAVCSEYGVASRTLAQKSSRHPARSIVALLAAENSTATLQEIAAVLGLADRRSVPQVIQRAKTNTSLELQHRLSIIQSRLEIVEEQPRLTK